MKTKLAAILAAGSVLAPSPKSAAAELSCYPLSEIERVLDAGYGQVRHFAGRETTGIEYRLYVNARTGSWSWIGIPDGTEVGCLIFAGRPAAAPPRRDSPRPAPSPQARF